MGQNHNMDLTVEEYLEYKKKNIKDSVILERLSYSPLYKEKLTKWKRDNGLPIGKTHKQFVMEQVREMKEQGLTCLQIGKLLHVSNSSVGRWLKEERSTCQ